MKNLLTSLSVRLWQGVWQSTQISVKIVGKCTALVNEKKNNKSLPVNVSLFRIFKDSLLLTMVVIVEYFFSDLTHSDSFNIFGVHINNLLNEFKISFIVFVFELFVISIYNIFRDASNFLI